MKHALHHQGRLSLVGARRRARASSGAFMLLETVLAVLVMAMALFAILEGVNRCVAATISIRNHSIASTLLSNKSYELRTEMAEDVDDLAEEFGDVAGFRWERRFEETADTQDNKIWIQHLTVYWQERGHEASETLTEYRYLPDKQF